MELVDQWGEGPSFQKVNNAKLGETLTESTD